ncbi:PREDICTED: U-box domain-containing protein 11 [Tarenaya hassleriana]|uniref:U-box domain-containing protein 11 n=1 Tax=Tarenaya hassleriana TaxID=28532 RepID=UPI00053C9C1D|nr:PREDICTED: U-box domain-containing protein 11 [Tarenaya hassleriana]
MEATKRRTIQSSVSKLSSVSEQTRAAALAELRLISKHDADSRPIIVDAGAVPYLAETLYSDSHESQENAAATLLNLSIATREPLMATRGLLDAISHALRHHDTTTSSAAVQSSAATLYSLLIAEEAYRPIIGSKRDIVFSLIHIIRSPNSHPRSIKDSLKALFGISLYPMNRSTMISLGAIPALFSLIVKDSRLGIVEDATAVVAQVAGCEDAEEAMRKVSGVDVLADLLDPCTGSSERIKENAVAAMLNLTRCGGERAREEVAAVVAAAGKEGIMDVAENGTAKGRRKAEDLLKVVACGNGDSRFDYLIKRSE